MKVKAIEVVGIATNEVIDTIDLHPPVENDSRYLERVLSGLLTQMDTDRFFAREVEAA